MSELVHRRTTVSHIAYRIVWSTKRRKRVLVPELAHDLSGWLKETAITYRRKEYHGKTGQKETDRFPDRYD